MQAELIDQYAKLSDIVISTALIPGRKAPILVHKKTVEQMKPGSIVVDLATSRGGNCELSVRDQTIKHGEVTIIGLSNLACLVPATASDLYANNLVHLINLLAAKPPFATPLPSGERPTAKQSGDGTGETSYSDALRAVDKLSLDRARNIGPVT